MKRIAPDGYYFGVDPDKRELLGYWRQAEANGLFETADPLADADTRRPSSKSAPGSG
jgi:hypothetical protein